MSTSELSLFFFVGSNISTAVIEGDPVDVAIELGITIGKPDQVALVNMANDKRAGGDWEAGKSIHLFHSILHPMQF